MAKVYGSAASGAVKQAMDQAVERLSPPEPERQYRSEVLHPDAMTPTGDGWTWVALLGAMTIFSVYDKQRPPIIIFCAVLTISVYAYSTRLNRRQVGKVPIDFEESHPEYIEQIEAVKQYVLNDFQKVIDTGKTTGTVFDGEEKNWAVGAAGEIQTSWLIQDGLDDSFLLVDDMEINKNGKVSANIDHLVNSPRGSIMVDTKVWNRKLEFAQTDRGVIIPKTCFASGSVSTCIYEASMLPGTVRAIVFAVRGRSASQLKQPVQVNLYHERFDSSNNAKVCPMPVLFVEQSQIAPVIAALDSQLPAATPVDVDAFKTTGHSAAQ